MKNAFAGIVLAAGSSRRAGPHVNKLTVEFDGKPLVCHAVDALLGADCDPVLVVTGHEAEAVGAALCEYASAPAVRIVQNERHTEGMGASIRCGVKALAALRPTAAGVFVLPGDMPRIRADHVRAVRAAFAGGDARTICVPIEGRRRGHPVLFGAGHFAALRRVSGDRGARGILETNEGCVIEVPIDAPEIHFDVDRPGPASSD